MELSPLQLIGGAVTSAAGGGGMSAFFNWLGSRSKTKAYTMGAVDHAVQTAMSSVTGQLERTEARLEAVEGQHKECEDALRKVREDLDETKRDRTELKAEIDRLMAGPVASYAPNGPK